MKKIKFKSGNLILRGNLIYPQHKSGKHPAILFVHGWESNNKKDNEYSGSLVDLGYICMTFDLGGHGESSGDKTKISRKEYVDEVIDAYDYLASQEEVDKNNIHLVGSSFGCYLAAIASGKRNIKSLLLRAPQNYPDEGYSKPKVDLQGDKLKIWRNKKLKSAETNSLKKLSRFKGKVLIMESELDNYVPQQTYRNYIDAVPKNRLTYKFMKGFNHSINSEKEKRKYIEILRKWFKK